MGLKVSNIIMEKKQQATKQFTKEFKNFLSHLTVSARVLAVTKKFVTNPDIILDWDEVNEILRDDSKGKGYNLFEDGDRLANHFGRFFPLCFVLLVGFVAEGRTTRIEPDGHVRRAFTLQHIFQTVDEATDGRSVETLRIDPGCLEKGIIGPIN